MRGCRSRRAQSQLVEFQLSPDGGGQRLARFPFDYVAQQDVTGVRVAEFRAGRALGIGIAHR